MYVFKTFIIYTCLYILVLLLLLLITTCVYVLLVYSLVGSCGVGGSGDFVSRRGAGGVLPPHHPHPHPADFPHPLRFNCMDICSSFATVGSLSEYHITIYNNNNNMYPIRNLISTKWGALEINKMYLYFLNERSLLLAHTNTFMYTVSKQT